MREDFEAGVTGDSDGVPAPSAAHLTLLNRRDRRHKRQRQPPSESVPSGPCGKQRHAPKALFGAMGVEHGTARPQRPGEAGAQPVGMIAFKRFMLLALLWVVLTAGANEGLWPGVVAAVGGTWVSLVLLPPDKPVKVLALMRMLPGFIWRSLLGGVDVAWRALHPRMPLKPGWLLLPTALPEGGPRVALGGEFSLLPGTLVAGTRDGMLLVHCLDVDQPVERAVRREEDEIGAAIGLRLSRDLPPNGRAS